MKKLFVVAAAVLVLALAAGIAYASTAYGTEYTFGGLGPTTAGYGPGSNVRSVVIHAESGAMMDTFKVNGISYKSTCRWLTSPAAWHCHTPLLAPTYPMFIEIGTGSFWWVDVTEYYSRWIALLPEIHGISHPTQRPTGPTNTPVPTDHPFAEDTPEPVTHPFDSSVAITPEVP
jgi:hypothetical protein